MLQLDTPSYILRMPEHDGILTVILMELVVVKPHNFPSALGGQTQIALRGSVTNDLCDVAFKTLYYGLGNELPEVAPFHLLRHITQSFCGSLIDHQEIAFEIVGAD